MLLTPPLSLDLTMSLLQLGVTDTADFLLTLLSLLFKLKKDSHFLEDVMKTSSSTGKFLLPKVFGDQA